MASPGASPPESVAAPALVLCGKGVVVYADPALDCVLAFPARCHRWDCPVCSKYRAAIARAEARAGQPERMLTLTLRHRQGEKLSERVDFIRKSFRQLSQRVRRNFGDFEWFSALELQKNGTPHLHILTKGCYIPQKWWSNAWMKLTGAFKVDIRKIDHSRGAIEEVCKYLTKSAAQIQKELPGHPVYTMSRGWLPESYKAMRYPEPVDPHARWFDVTLHDFRDLVESLGGSLEVLEGRAHHWQVAFPRPPTTDDLEALRIWPGDPSERLALHLISRFDPEGPNLAEMQRQAEAERCMREPGFADWIKHPW